MHQSLLAGFARLRVQPRNLLPAGMKITSYNHHAKAPSSPGALVLKPSYRVDRAFALIQSTSAWGLWRGFRSERRPNQSTRSQGAGTVVSSAGNPRHGSYRAKPARIGSFRAFWQCVFEVIGVLAVGDDDRHCSCDASEPSRARAGHHCDGDLKLSLIHRAIVLEGEGTAVAVEGSGDALDCHVTGSALGGVAGPKHLAFARGLEIAVELLVERIAANANVYACTSGGVIRRKRGGFYLEGSGGVEWHGGILPKSF